MDESVPILGRRSGDVGVSGARWYILATFSLVSILQDTVWNTWGPIEHTAKYLYGWSDELVALFVNYGSIMYIVAFVPVVYLLQHSLRGAMLMTTGFMAIGTILRSAIYQNPSINLTFFTISCHVCSILNGIANIVIGSAPLVISSSWFPASERITATSVAQVANGLGTGMSFLLASQLVRPIDKYGNDSDITPEIEEGLKSDIRWYMYSQSIPAGIFFLLCLIYFPSKPNQPPSISSAEARLDFFSGFKQVLGNKVAWAIAVGSSIPQGITIAWIAMMVVNLSKVCVGKHCLSQHWINYLGIYASLTGTLAAIFVARIVDYVKGYLKLVLVVLLGVGGLVFTFLSLISTHTLTFHHLVNVQISVYLLLLLGSGLVVATMPLSMELAMEACYPVSECVVGGWISIWFNISTVVFLSLFNIPGIGTSWLDYVLPVASFISLPFFFFRVEYKRSAVDVDSFAGEDEEENS